MHRYIITLLLIQCMFVYLHQQVSYYKIQQENMTPEVLETRRRFVPCWLPGRYQSDRSFKEHHIYSQSCLFSINHTQIIYIVHSLVLNKPKCLRSCDIHYSLTLLLNPYLRSIGQIWFKNFDGVFFTKRSLIWHKKKLCKFEVIKVL